MATGVERNLAFRREASAGKTFRFLDALGEPVDLTGFSAIAWMALDWEADRLNFTQTWDRPNGLLLLTLPDNVIDALEAQTHVYKLHMVHPSSFRQPIHFGKVSVLP